VNQLLDLQRLDAGRMQPSFPRDLVEFVSQIIESFRPYCEKEAQVTGLITVHVPRYGEI